MDRNTLCAQERCNILVQVVLSSTKIIEKSDDYEGFRSILRDGLFLSKGDKWRTRRKLLTPTFHLKILHDFTPVLQETAKNFVADLQTVTNESWVDIFLIMKTCSLNMLLRTTLGFDVDVKNKEAVECLKASDDYTTCLSARLARPWLFSDKIFKFTALCKRMESCSNLAHNFLRKVIKLKKQNMIHSGQLNSKNGVKLNGYTHFSNGVTTENGNYLFLKSKNKAFLDLLLEHHFQDNSLTEEDILDETLSFFAAGAETLGSAISYVLYSIGLHEEVQTKLHEEQDKIFGNTDRDLVEEDIKRMEYLDCVIKEGLRLYSASFVSRRATEDFKVFDYTIQKGSIVVIFNYVIHRDPRYYPNPEKFDPSRFFPENCIGRHPFAYLPFSAGPRNCIGQKFTLLEMKTVCSAILRKYHLTSIDNTDELYKISNLTNLTNVPVRLKFKLRNNT
nr:cytochrome P450 4V2 [Parasteatoda tepidariorum]